VSVIPEGRKLLRLEVRNAQTPIEKKPEWIKTKASMGPQYRELQSLVKSEGLHTVCQEAGCPNIFECWEDREATFLIGGDQCTRRCDFCQIDTGKPADFDADEPRRVAESVRTMELRYATVTGVARDDLADGGAWLYAETVRQIHALNPGPASSCSSPTSTPSRTSCARCSVRLPRCWHTTSRRCRGSSSGSVPASATSVRSTSSPPHGLTVS
jgi:lipoic acid synthetase